MRVTCRTECEQTIFEPGWAGELSPAEYQQVYSALKSNRKLRTWWGFVHGNGRLSPETIREVARWGDPSDRSQCVALIRRTRATVTGQDATRAEPAPQNCQLRLALEQERSDQAPVGVK